MDSIKRSPGTEAESSSVANTTLFEKKAALVETELECNGMGRYQWWVWALCGLGYFVDLMWAQAFGLVTPAMQAELGFPSDQYGNIFSSFSAGLTAGAFVWGILVDIIGRSWAFNLTLIFSSVFGISLGGPSDYNSILVLAAWVGFGVGGNVPIDTTICLEFIPRRKRFLLALLSLFQPLGVVVASGIAYGLVPKYACTSPDGKTPPSCNSVRAGELCCTKESNMGWRYTLFVLGAITLLAFILRVVFFRFQESPKYLVYRGQDAKAVKVLHYIAQFNHRSCGLTLEDLLSIEETSSEIRPTSSRHVANDSSSTDSSELGSPRGFAPSAGSDHINSSWIGKVKSAFMPWKLLFSDFETSRLTILIWIAYIFDYWSFTVAGSFLPKILLEKNKSISVGVEETYRNYVIIYLPGILGVASGALMYRVPFVGRKWGMVGSSALMGLSLFLFATINTEASNVGLNVMEYFFQSMYNAILYGWTPEAYPTPIRGTAAGVASFWGRLFSIIAPIIAGHIYNASYNGVLYMAGATALISCAAILFLPNRRLNE